MERIGPPSPRLQLHLDRGRRDASLTRITRISGMAAVVALGLVMALDLYVSHALPGHRAATSKAGVSPTAASSAGGGTSTAQAAGSGASTGSSTGASSAITPPSQAPVTTPAAPQAITAAS